MEDCIVHKNIIEGELNMASIKPKRAMLNTTINEEVLAAFKDTCKESGINMNIIIETFMKQFADGEFTLKFGKSNNLSVDLGDTTEEE
jgi:hypothetical protein